MMYVYYAEGAGAVYKYPRRGSGIAKIQDTIFVEIKE